jgi:hypothetical protein
MVRASEGKRGGIAGVLALGAGFVAGFGWILHVLPPKGGGWVVW